jgi:hypothetical protein
MTKLMKQSATESGTDIGKVGGTEILKMEVVNYSEGAAITAG